MGSNLPRRTGIPIPCPLFKGVLTAHFYLNKPKATKDGEFHEFLRVIGVVNYFLLMQADRKATNKYYPPQWTPDQVCRSEKLTILIKAYHCHQLLSLFSLSLGFPEHFSWFSPAAGEGQKARRRHHDHQVKDGTHNYYISKQTKILCRQLNCSIKLADVLTRCSSHPQGKSRNVGKFYRTVKLSAKNLRLFHADSN